MAKVTGKFQITLPKAVADQCGIEIGDELELRVVGRSIVVDTPGSTRIGAHSRKQALSHFDHATRRQAARQATGSLVAITQRDWTREQLYARGSPG